MISWGDFYGVMVAVVPLYVDMILAYGSVRWWKIFTPEQCAGINRFVAVFAVPLLSFHFLAENNPYRMNIRFLAADTLQKVLILVVLILWAQFSRRTDAMDWLITIFSLSTLPNTLIMGIPLLGGMYDSGAKALMVQVVVLQCIIWYTLLLFLFEYRDAIKLIAERFPDNATTIATVRVDPDVASLRDGETDSHVGTDGRLHVTVRMSTSPVGTPPKSLFTPQQSSTADIYNSTPRFSNLSSGEYNPAAWYGIGYNPSIGSQSNYGLADMYRSPRTPNYYPTTSGKENANFRGGKISEQSRHVEIDSNELRKFVRSTSAPPTSEIWGMGDNNELSFAGGRGGGGVEEIEKGRVLSNFEGEAAAGGGKKMPSARVVAGLILSMVWRKLIRNPNTYASILGLAWSLIEFRYEVRLPTIVDNSIAILSNAGLGMAMFSLGLFMALQPKLIACGNGMALVSFGVRFLFGPAMMALASFAIGLKGNLFRIAIVQAALPQGIVPFVFAKEYKNHPTILSTGVIFGLIVALPIDLIYYALLEL